MKVFKIAIVLALTTTAVLFLAEAIAGSPDGRRQQGIRLTGKPAFMHRVLISFESTPGDGERARVIEMGGNVRRLFRLVPAMAAQLPERALNTLAARPGVMRIEADGRIKAVDELTDAWGVTHILSDQVHARGVTGAGVKVAVIDSGIDYTHPDLTPNYAGGIDFVGTGDPDPMDDYGHGTHVAGIIAATYDGAGVVGVAPDVELYALKVLDHTGNGYWSDVIAAIEWAVDHGIHITNNSYGDDADPDGGAPQPGAVQTAFDNAEALGMLHIAAAGNDGNADGTGDNVIYPARFESVIAVASIAFDDNRASSSSTGPAVELAAPGVSIYSTLLSGGYGYKSGTSMASPHAAGVAALVIAAGITDDNANGRINDEVRAVLMQSADDLGAIGRDDFYGWGLVNAARAAIPCRGDGDSDEDVDGSDLADHITNPTGVTLEKFSQSYGRSGCP